MSSNRKIMKTLFIRLLFEEMSDIENMTKEDAEIEKKYIDLFLLKSLISEFCSKYMSLWHLNGKYSRLYLIL